MAGYTNYADPDKTACAIGKEMNISPKKSMEICTALRNMHVMDAKEFLNDVIALKAPVPYKRFNHGVARKKGINAPGGYPKKAAAAILKILESAQYNAEYKGLESEEMYIKVISASRGRVTPHFKPRAHGRATPYNRESVNVEVILETLEG